MQNIALINLELFSSVSEREEKGITGEVKHDGPVPMRHDRFWNVHHSKFELDLTDGLIIGEGGVETREYVVKVNGFTLGEIEPFCIRESRASWGIDDNLIWLV